MSSHLSCANGAHVLSNGVVQGQQTGSHGVGSCLGFQGQRESDSRVSSSTKAGHVTSVTQLSPRQHSVRVSKYLL